MWVFAYGSLLWNPGFEPERSVRGSLTGFRRSFCMRSIHHRGSEEEPGLVLALDAEDEASCTGLALKVKPTEEAAVLAELRERELISSAYVERHVPIALDTGEEVEALAYVIEKAHGQYCQIPLSEQARIIATAIGGRGPNWEYLYNTCAKFDSIGVDDPDLSWLRREVEAIRAAGAS